jgi:hypothetical protein
MVKDLNEPGGAEGHEPPNTGKPSQKKQDVLTRVENSGAATVVLRASLDTFGVAGDAELQFTVKWPAAALASARQTASAPGDTGGGVKMSVVHANGTIDSGGNLSAPATRPSGSGSH